ncbi:MAG: CaiB/BaiF CoA-transferase family protein, partial [Burkholderiaceae bacterium]
PVADLCSGIFASQGVLLALHKRAKTGLGQWVQASLLQSMVFMMDFQASRWLMDKDVPKQAGNNHPTSIPTGVFETSDGHINIASAGQAIWERLLNLLDDNRMRGDDYRTGESRSKNRDALNALINEHTRKQSSAQWIEQLNDAGVPCGEINNMQQVFEMEQTRQLDLIWDVDSHERGKSQLVGQPILFSDSKARITMPPPKIGEHSDEVLKDIGYSADEIKKLSDDGVI